MGQSRLELHDILVDLIDGAGKVYFQPEPKLVLKYPCIVYKRDQARNLHADNSPYKHTKRYMITVIDEDPDSVIPDKIAALPMSTFNRNFATDNLTHDIYSLYF